MKRRSRTPDSGSKLEPIIALSEIEVDWRKVASWARKMRRQLRRAKPNATT